MAGLMPTMDSSMKLNVLGDGCCFSELLQCRCLAIGTISRKYQVDA